MQSRNSHGNLQRIYAGLQVQKAGDGCHSQIVVSPELVVSNMVVVVGGNGSVVVDGKPGIKIFSFDGFSLGLRKSFGNEVKVGIGFLRPCMTSPAVHMVARCGVLRRSERCQR